MRAYERLLKYVVVRTPSDENSETVPSSQCQFDLANILVEELKALGIDNAYVDEKCFVYGKLAATPGYENAVKLGFIAHMDTVSDFCDHDITPVITENYNGEDLDFTTRIPERLSSIWLLISAIFSRLRLNARFIFRL